MTNSIFIHRDPVELFNRLMVPVAHQIHTANMALKGWLAHEVSVCSAEIRAGIGGKLARRVEVGTPYEADMPAIKVATTSGGVGSDNGTGLIFYLRVEIIVRPLEDVTLSEEEKTKIIKWLAARYPTAHVANYSAGISVDFELEKNQIATF